MAQAMAARRWTEWLAASFRRRTMREELRGVTSRLPADEAYALWAATYPPSAHNPLMEAEQAVVGPMLESIRPRRALDVGTGTGRNLRLLRQAGTARGIGMDRSWPMLERAK